MEKIKKTRNCGPRVDLTNKQFGRLTALYYIKGGKWHCKCSCGNELDVDTRNLNSGHTLSCGCYQKEMASKNTIDMLNYENDGIKVIDYAKSTSDKQTAQWKCLCKICGNIFITRGTSIRCGSVHSCGCVHSSNEKKITKLLIENNIDFSTQYTFNDLKGVNGGTLRFDFAIFKNNKLSHLIEYNGKQHYECPAGSWQKEYNNLIENDKRKIQYCQEHNIELRIIPYNKNYSLQDLI